MTLNLNFKGMPLLEV